jgi:hypothetical protein
VGHPEGIGRAHALSADAADLLVPFMFIIWQSTIRPAPTSARSPSA